VLPVGTVGAVRSGDVIGRLGAVGVVLQVRPGYRYQFYAVPNVLPQGTLPDIPLELLNR